MDKETINSLYQIGIEIDFENIYSYCKFTEAALSEEKRRFREIYEAKTAALTSEEKQSFERFAIDIHWKLHGVFPALQWTSVFASAYSLFERHLNDLCEHLRKDRAIKTKLTDLPRQGIERAKIFLSKVVGITDIFGLDEWANIQNYSKVRNILMHTSGRLDLRQKKHKQVFNYARRQPGMMVFPEDPQSDSAEITVLPDYVYQAIPCYTLFLVRICKSRTR